MGYDLYFDGNPENSLYGWIKKYYPDYAQWVFTYSKILTETGKEVDKYPWQLTPTLIKTVQALGPVLPEEAILKKYHPQTEIAALVDHLYFSFGDFLYCHFKMEIGLDDLYSSVTLYPYFFSILSHIFAETFERRDLATLIEQVFGRLYSSLSGVSDKRGNAPSFGFWTAQECLLLEHILPRFYDPTQPQYAQIETQIRAYVQADDDRFEDDDPEEVLLDVRNACIEIMRALERRPPDWGIVIRFSF